MLCLRILAAFSLLSGLAALSGCTMCVSPDTEAYPTYGGIWQRTDRYHGRVGSVFEPAGVKVARASEEEPLPVPELVPPAEPTPADETPGGADDAQPGEPTAPSTEAQQPGRHDIDQELEDIRRRLRERQDVEEVQL